MGTIGTKLNINTSDGLVPNRKQAITWTKDEQVFWHHIASLGLS